MRSRAFDVRAVALVLAVVAAAHRPAHAAEWDVASPSARTNPSRSAAASRRGGPARPTAALGASPALEIGDDDLFPSEFVFGVAASSFQIEGDGGDRPRSVWDDFADRRDLGEDARAGIRHYEHRASDIRFMARAGVKHYRLSLSWPRLMRADRTPIEEGYAFYDALLDELRDAGITPYVTLHHWDFPDWLCARGPSADDASLGAVDPEGASRDPASCPGAWLDPGVVADFQTYADQAFARLGPKVHFWATINEPKTVANMGYGVGAHAPGIVSATAPLVAGHNMLLAHAAAAKTYREKYRDAQAGSVTMVVNSDWREPARVDDPADVAAATRAMEEEMGWFADPLYFGDYPASMRERYGEALPRFTEAQSASLRGSTDYFGLNHYTSLYASAAELSPANSYLGRAMDWTTSDVGADGAPIGDSSSCAWLKDVPWGLGKTLDYVKIRYENPPVYITENGVSANPAPDAPLDQALDDASRVKYISGYLKATLGALRGGADVRGYFYWSVFDNFEWAEGSATRFGLVHVDHRGTYGGEWTTRRAKRSLGFYRDFMIGRHSEGRAAALEGKIVVPAADASDAFYGGEPLPWETATEPEAPPAAALGLVPATRTNAASASTSSTTKRRVAALAAARAARVALGRRHGPAEREASTLGASADPDAEERVADARRERYAGVALAAAEEALTRARRSTPPGEDPVADRLLSDAARALSEDAAYASASSASASSSNDADALLAEAERVLALAEKEDAAARKVRGGGIGIGVFMSPNDGVLASVSAMTESWGPVVAATVVGVVFGLVLIGIQVACNAARGDGKRGCGTNAGEVRSLVAEGEALKKKTQQKASYGA